jgi:RNAse (barnase) inhibitor barstar
MFEPGKLLDPSGPFFTLLEADAAALAAALAAFGAHPEATVRVVEGPGLATAPALIGALARALEFPDYFGRNWDAVDECLSDLEWLPSRHVVLVFPEAGKVLAQSPGELETLSEILLTTAEAWAEVSSPGTPMSFHVLLQDGAPGLRRWEQACRLLEIPFARISA